MAVDGKISKLNVFVEYHGEKVMSKKSTELLFETWKPPAIRTRGWKLTYFNFLRSLFRYMEQMLCYFNHDGRPWNQVPTPTS
jgi:hypothetical protein